tara:strand:- start:205 stop:318 length:114 start_codon:yes stop_codon:yes gene_type:complete
VVREEGTDDEVRERRFNELALPEDEVRADGAAEARFC